MRDIDEKVQSLRSEYMDALRKYTWASRKYLKQASNKLRELQKLTNNAELTGLDVVKNNIPQKEAKR